MTEKTDDNTEARVAEILNHVGDLGTMFGWKREEVAVALAMGAADLALYNSTTPADVDRSLGALIRLMRHRAYADRPADPGHGDKAH